MSNDDPVTVIPHTFTQVTKFWLAAAGGVGCFAHEKHRETLGEVARHTGTEIAIIDEIKGLQVSGGNEGDVNDALERLSRIETPLVREPGFLVDLLTILTVLSWQPGYQEYCCWSY